MFIIERFEKIVQKYPNNIALKLEDGRNISYEKLNDVANEIGFVINQINHKVTTITTPLIGVMFNRDIGFFASILGILKAECGYVPIDPSFPSDRQSYIFSHSKCELLLADQESYDQAINLGVILPNVCIIIESKTGSIKEYINIKIEKKENLSNISKNRKYNRDSFAYILYTSGSTGKPKGVMVKQTAVANFVDWVTSELQTNSNKIVLALTTFCFDVSISEIFQALTMGATLVVALSTTQKNPYRLIDLINETGVEVMHATPTTFEMMLATGWTGDSKIDFLVAGEAFRPSLLNIVYNCRSIRNAYGPSETTTYSSSFTLTKSYVDSLNQDDIKKIHIPIGPPILNTIFYIVNPESSSSWTQVTDDGEGELWIGGDGLAEGYLYDTNLTIEKFIKNPFDSGFVYRTGDIVQRLSDPLQAYVYLRRMDDQVKVNGFRIELQEIEVVYNQHTLLEQTVALVRNGKIILYMKARNKKELSSNDLEDIRKYASKSLMYYMMPSFIVQIVEWPKTSSDKIDKKSLPDPPGLNEFTIAIVDDDNINGPTTISSILCSIIASTRGTQLTKSSTFASIGIDSFGAILFLRQVSNKFGNIKIDARQLYSPGVTVRSFAKNLYSQLKVEKPELIQNLYIVEESDEDVKDSILPFDSCNDSLEEMLASNLRLIEGVRGVLVFLVFWDHYFWNWTLQTFKSGSYTAAYRADTSCFIILSAFIVSFTYCRGVKFQKSNDKIELSMQQFNWKTFIITRITGLYPILWICLILYAPIWPQQVPWDIFIVYVLGMQSWMHNGDKYTFRGPAHFYYASIVINCFLMYALVRVVCERIQNYLMSWRHPLLDSQLSRLAFDEILDTKGKTWTEYVGNIVTILSVNKANRLLAVLYTMSCILLGTGIVVIDFKNRALKDPQEIWTGWQMSTYHFIVYYLLGTLAASVVATWHSTMYATLKYDDLRFNCSLGDLPDRLNFFCPRRSESTPHSTVFYLWRHTPDMIAVAFALLMTTVGDIHHSDEVVTGEMGGLYLQWLFVAYLITATLQSGPARLNFGRYLLETPVVNLLGYCSYPLYLMQIIIPTYNDMYWKLNKDRTLGPYKSLGWKFVLSIIMIVAAVCIQYCIQDVIVPYLVIKISSCYKKIDLLTGKLM